MVATLPRSRSIFRILRRPWLCALVSIPLFIAAACWWWTAPLEPLDPARPLLPISAAASATVVAVKALEWPEGRLDGMPAKQFLLQFLLEARDRLEAMTGYTGVLRKQERVGGTLGEEQVLEIKVRHRPFAVYLKFRHPEPGKEVVYAEGRYDNHVIAHGAGVSRLLIPRLKVPPDSVLALAGNRHPITEAGLANLTTKLIGYREMDLQDPDAVTILDRNTDAEGRTWFRSLHTHPRRKPGRPFARVEVLYDPETRLPASIRSHDWPEPDQAGDPPLAERYAYEQLEVDPPLTDLDFDPANPAYAFSRF